MRSPVLFLVCVPIAAQTPRFSFGLTGGIPISGMTPGNPVTNGESRQYTIGPTLEISLADRISVNVNPLCRRAGSSSTLFRLYSDAAIPYASAQSTWRTRVHSLELPVIGKYYFGDSRKQWRPFAGAGFSFHSA